MFSLFKKKVPVSDSINDEEWPESIYSEGGDLSVLDIKILHSEFVKENKINTEMSNEDLKKKLKIADYLTSWIKNEVEDDDKIDVSVCSGVYPNSPYSYVTLNIKYGNDQTFSIAVYAKKSYECKSELIRFFKFIENKDYDVPRETSKKKVVARKKTAKKKAPVKPTK